MIGIDVRDSAKALVDQYLDGVSEVGHVLTVKPGLFLKPDDLLLRGEIKKWTARLLED